MTNPPEEARNSRPRAASAPRKPCVRCGGPTVPADLTTASSSEQAYVCYACNTITWGARSRKETT